MAPIRSAPLHAPRALARHLVVALGVVGTASAEEPVEAPAAEVVALEPGGGVSDAFTVVTLNAWGLPPIFAPRRNARLAEAGAWLDTLGPDLVALQEIWDGAVRPFPLEVVRSEGADDGLGLRADGLHDVEVLRFRRARGFDALKRKGALRARWTTPSGHEAWVVVTHMQASRGRGNGAVRADQLRELVAWMDAVDGPVLLMGDLNVDERHPEDADVFAVLEASGFVDVAASAGETTPTYEGDGNRYDRILVRGGGGLSWSTERVRVVVYDDDPGTAAPPMLSDHRPIVASLRLAPSGGADGRRAVATE